MIEVEARAEQVCNSCHKGASLEDYVKYEDGYYRKREWQGIRLRIGPKWAFTKLVLCDECAGELLKQLQAAYSVISQQKEQAK